MDWSNFHQQALRAKAQRRLIETERVVHNSMIDLESHLSDANPEEETRTGTGGDPVPQFWLYAERVGLVCQRCDTTLFVSPEDADFANLEKVVREHVCEPERKEAA